MKFSLTMSISSLSPKRMSQRPVRETVAFGAKTLPGSGAALLPEPLRGRAVEVVGGTAADRIDLSGGRLTPRGALADGDSVELRLDDGGRAALEIATIPAAFSAASLGECRAAFRAAAYGDAILLRSGDYGYARDAAQHPNFGWPSGDEADWTHAGDPAADGPIVVTRHPDETPAIWELFASNLKHVTFRDLDFALAPLPKPNSFSGPGKAPLRVEGRYRAVMAENCRVIGRDIASPEDGMSAHLASGVRFSPDDGWGENSGFVDGVIRNVYDGAKVGGPGFRLERNLIRAAYNDAITGGGARMDDARTCWNVVEKSVINGVVSELVEIEVTSSSTATLRLAAGEVSRHYWAHRYSEGAAIGFNAAAAAITPGGSRQPGSNVDFGDASEFDVDADEVYLTGLSRASLGVYAAPPGAKIISTTAHSDFATQDHQLSAERWHVVGNVFLMAEPHEFHNPVHNAWSTTGKRLSLADGDSRDDDSPAVDHLFVGNRVHMSGNNGPGIAYGRNAFMALNTSLSGPFDPRTVEAGPGGSTRASMAVRTMTSGGATGGGADEPFDPEATTFTALNCTHGMQIQSESGGLSQDDFEQIVQATPADYDANFEHWPDYRAQTAGLSDDDVLRIAADLFRPKPGSPIDLAGAGAFGRPDLIDHAGRSYDAAGLYALRDSYIPDPDQAADPVHVTLEGGGADNPETDPLVVSTYGSRALAVIATCSTFGGVGGWTATVGVAGRARGAGQAMTLARSAANSRVAAAVFVLAAPESGAKTVQIDMGSATPNDLALTVMELQDVGQIGATAAASGDAATLTPGLPAVAAGSRVLYCAAQRNGASEIPAVSGATPLATGQGRIGRNVGHTYGHAIDTASVAGASAGTFDWSGNTDDAVALAIEVTPPQ